MHSVELVEDLLHVLLLDAQTSITDAEAETLLLVPGTDIKIERLVWLAILYSVVHQVGDGILEVYLVDEDSRIHSLDLRIDMASSMFHSQRECRGDVLQQLVEVEFLLLERYRLFVEHRHLQHLLHKEAQTFRLVVDHTSQVFQHRRCLGYSLVVEHLCSQRDTADRRLQLVGHIVDEVVLNLRIALLAEDDEDREDKGDNQHNREDDSRNHKSDAREDIGTHVGEVNLHHTHLRRRVVAEKRLLIGVLLTFLTIVRTAIHLTTIGCFNAEMIGNINTIVHQLYFDVAIKQFEVDTLLQGFV